MDNNILLQKAKEASKKAYAPYSQFPVGACVLTDNNNTYCGCNIENASYGLTVCAERNAISNAIINGESKITKVAIFSPKMENCTPCGACRQVILEFAKDGEIEVITEDKKEVKTRTIKALLPEGFML